jgi:hypothetical protein
MDVTPSGMAIEVKFEQLVNTLMPMVVNWELGPNVTDVKLEQLRNADEPMTDTKYVIVMEVKPDY